MTRLEIYGALLVVLALAIGGAYFKGCRDTERRINNEQAAVNAKALQDAADAATRRAAADDAGRLRAQQFIESVEQGLTDVQQKFAKVPTVVVDGRGCDRLTDAARLRWNAVSLLPSGPPLDDARIPPQAVPAGAVPTP